MFERTTVNPEIRIRYGEKVVLRRKKNTYLQLFDGGRQSPYSISGFSVSADVL